ncbi:MAG: tetratricopeptide repeat protein, partial [Elusimicrobia bacterium]|nr:tetratricopeptide repeat protein [Elusimicrobiota bacterium]
AGLGTRIWVHCWRGAAYLKLGERGKALADLDAAIEADPQDLEAYVWRGEAYRLMGRNAEALRDLDRAVALDPKYVWAYVNRALARGAMGDAKGMAADVAMIPDDVVAAVRGPKQTRVFLEKALERAGGIRRPEHYFNAIWMRRGGTCAPRSRPPEAAAKALRKAGGPRLDEALREWPDVFSELLCARKYREAFRLGDAMLEKSAALASANGFLWPWWSGVSSRGSARKMKFCAQELGRLRRAARTGGFPGWFAYCRGVLLIGLGRDEEAMAEYERVKRLPAARYALMHHPFVMNRLLAGDVERTIDACRGLLEHAPDYWWFQCRLAEAYMARGDVAKGLREFERAAARAAGAWARRSILTWHGAALLWAGEYRRALAKLDEAAGLGTRIWVHCWRGAAYLKLGERGKALADLDAAIEADPQDLEAYVWRGEARRLMGRNAEALRDLDRAIALDPKYTWAYVNRALARGASGDAKGMAADVAMIPDDVVAAVRGPKETRVILEKALERAKGIRRPERYLDAMWRSHG